MVDLPSRSKSSICPFSRETSGNTRSRVYARWNNIAEKRAYRMKVRATRPHSHIFKASSKRYRSRGKRSCKCEHRDAGKYKAMQSRDREPRSRREESFNARCESIERNRSQTYAGALHADEQTPAIQVRFGSERAKGKLKQGPKIRVKRRTS